MAYGVVQDAPNHRTFLDKWTDPKVTTVARVRRRMSDERVAWLVALIALVGTHDEELTFFEDITADEVRRDAVPGFEVARAFRRGLFELALLRL